MNHVHRILAIVATIAMGGLLGACSTVQPVVAEPAAATGAAQGTKAAEPARPIAGSRLPATSTDRMVKQIGAAGAQEMVRDKPGNPGRTAN